MPLFRYTLTAGSMPCSSIISGPVETFDAPLFDIVATVFGLSVDIKDYIDGPDSVTICQTLQNPWESGINVRSIEITLALSNENALEWAGLGIQIDFLYTSIGPGSPGIDYGGFFLIPALPLGQQPQPCPAGTIASPGPDTLGNLSERCVCINGVCECPIGCVPTPDIGNGYGSPPGSGGNGGHPSVPLMIR